jgi:dihydroflavonol-4-reductase
LKVLVTGANGFLGSHLVRALIEQNYEVHAMVRANSDKSSLDHLNCKIVVGDILDPISLRNCMCGMTGVFHVAGAMSSSPRDKEWLFNVNVKGVQNVIDGCIEKKVKRLVHVSSVVAVGTNIKEKLPPLNENSKNVTKSMGFANYDSKRQGEELVLTAAKNNLIEAVVVNPGLIYGAGDAKKIIRKGNILAAKGKLPVFTLGGVNIVAVEDVVKAMIEAYKVGHNGERYLLTGDNITIKKLLTTISQLAGARPPQKELPTGLAKIFATILDLLGFKLELCRENVFTATTFHWYDNAKARRDLKFNPVEYKVALKNSVDWMKENKYLE